MHRFRIHSPLPERPLDAPDNGDAEESDDILDDDMFDNATECYARLLDYYCRNRGRPLNGSEQTRIMGVAVKYAMPLAE